MPYAKAICVQASLDEKWYADAKSKAVFVFCERQ